MFVRLDLIEVRIPIITTLVSDSIPARNSLDISLFQVSSRFYGSGGENHCRSKDSSKSTMMLICCIGLVVTGACSALID